MLDTLNYMIAGYVVIFVFLGGYVLHLLRSRRKLLQEKKALEYQSQINDAAY